LTSSANFLLGDFEKMRDPDAERLWSFLFRKSAKFFWCGRRDFRALSREISQGFEFLVISKHATSNS
jgi:hypothetical protein